MKIRSGPGLPHVGAVAHGGLPAVADDGGAEEPGVGEQLLHPVLVVGQVAEQGGVRVFWVDECLQPHRLAHALQLPGADAHLQKVDGLELDAPLLEVPLRFFGVKALALAENLDVHVLFATMSSGKFKV